VNKRKSYFKVSDPLLQRDLLLYLVIFWGIWFVLQSLFIYVVLWTDLLETDGALNRGQLTILVSIFFSGALFLVAILLFNRILHQITGPIHRIKIDLDDFVTGNSQGPTQIRQGDYFKDLTESINRAFLKSRKDAEDSSRRH
jgi:hypothetical protein